jgi:phenylalanyl-tRNA synthetase beta chain
MKVSLNWLKAYVPIDMAVSDLADALTMAGLEVEAVDDRYAHLETVVVGQVVNVSPHPNADRLEIVPRGWW